MEGNNNAQLLMDGIRFYGWLFGSLCSLAITLLGVYLRMYVKDALHEHAEAIQGIVAANYVRRDVYAADIRGLLAQIRGNV